MARILIVDDEANICWALKAELTAAGYVAETAGNAQEALKQMEATPPDVLLCDIRLPGMSGLEILERVRAASSIPVILMTAYGSMDTTVDAMHKGAFEYLQKPLDLDRVKETIARALADRDEAVALQGRAPAQSDLDLLAPRLVGRSLAMQDVFKLIGLVSQNDVAVLIEGESGVGKESVARAIHRYSSRREAPFIAVDCGAFAEAVLPIELFGAEEGPKPGRLELASNGTVFLDEISALSQLEQTKLLRLFQDGAVERTGGVKPIPVNVRIIAASERPLREAVTAKRFRDDLFFRLQVVTIRLPPLRERKEDVYDLAAYFLALAGRDTQHELRGIRQDAMDAMLRYDWPGNVRELEAVIRRASVLTRASVIGLSDLPPEISHAEPKEELPVLGGLKAAAEAELRSRLQGSERGDISLYHDLIGTVEESLVQAALAITGGNQVRAAELLGVNRTTLRKRLQGPEEKQ
jgi:DNA-binding NtrC family response regulator